MGDPYVSIKTNVLINKLNIENSGELQKEERILSSLIYQNILMGKVKITRSFDYNHFKSLHQELFQDIYDWAGKERVVDISKPGTLFCRCLFLEEEAQRIFGGLKKENCFRDVKEKEELFKKIGQLFLDLNMLHPFREGNGRTQRLFISHVFEENGYSFNWKEISMEKMIEISQKDDVRELSTIFSQKAKKICKEAKRKIPKKSKNKDGMER